MAGKLKTNKATAKRFKLSWTGKIMHKRANKKHRLNPKSNKGKQAGKNSQVLSSANKKSVLKNLNN